MLAASHVLVLVVAVTYFKVCVVDLEGAFTKELVQAERICRLAGSTVSCALCLPEAGTWAGRLEGVSYVT
jgi:hypothetical protein